jgi:hypothetical protein
MGYRTDIIRFMSGIAAKTLPNPDSKHNQGALIGTAFMWDEIEAYAKKKSAEAWEKLESEGIIPDIRTLDGGDHELAYSPSFTVQASVSEPVRRFSREELAKLLAKSKYKVPVSVTAELCDQSRLPGNPQRKLKIVERS